MPLTSTSYKKGHGPTKPKGAISKKTAIWNEIGEWFVSDGMEQYKKNLSEMLKSKDKHQQEKGMQRLEAMMEYFKPKLQRTELSGKNGADLGVQVNMNVKPPSNAGN